jgi:hypothetical protein
MTKRRDQLVMVMRKWRKGLRKGLGGRGSWGD